VIHSLLGIALVVFVVWLVLQVIGLLFGGLLHLLWLAILVALAVWLWRLATGRHEAW
jgi:hypothetical protein